MVCFPLPEGSRWQLDSHLLRMFYFWILCTHQRVIAINANSRALYITYYLIMNFSLSTLSENIEGCPEGVQITSASSNYLGTLLSLTLISDSEVLPFSRSSNQPECQVSSIQKAGPPVVLTLNQLIIRILITVPLDYSGFLHNIPDIFHLYNLTNQC